jgi:hypothetical protein
MNAVEAKAYGLIDDVLGDTSDVVRLENGEFNVHFIVPQLQSGSEPAKAQ